MKTTRHAGGTIQHSLKNFLLSYRSTPHATTGVASSTLFLGRQLRTRLDLVKPDLSQTVHDKQASQKSYHDQYAHQQEFVIGEHIMAKNCLETLSGFQL